MLPCASATEALPVPRPPSPRKLQRAQSRRRSCMNERSSSSTPTSSVASGSAKKQNDKASSPESLNSTPRMSSGSSISRDSSLTTPHPLAPHSLRVHTKGALLTSGFAYHPALFDLKVHRIMWNKFTSQIVDAARLSTAERAKVWAIGTAAAVTTSSPDVYHVSRSKSQRIQEEKVKEGLKDESEDSLGDLLRQWNEAYFAERGLLARLEVSDSAHNSPSRSSNTLHEGVDWHLHRGHQERAKRKFSIVITQTCAPSELPDGERQPRTSQGSSASGSLKSIDEDSTSEKKSQDLSWFTPLPELPIAAHPLLDILSNFTNTQDIAERHDGMPHLHQVAELDGDGTQVLPKNHALVAELPAVEQQSEVQVTKDIGGSGSSQQQKQQKEVQEYLDLVSQPNSPAVDQPQETASDGHITRYKLFPDPHVKERPITGDGITHVGSANKPAATIASHRETVTKPMSSPSASFFLPLDIKPISATLDFDPQVLVKDMATAH